MTTPTKPGFYWAKWRRVSSGTDDNGAGCMGDKANWEVVEVWENDLDETSSEHLRVFVTGVASSQSWENFTWGPCVTPPGEVVDRLAELERTFDLRWKADMRAIARWRADDPNKRSLILPDHVDLVVWLLKRLDALVPKWEMCTEGLDVSLSDRIVAMRIVITDMETVKRRTPGYERLIADMRAALETLISLERHMNEVPAL